MCPPRFNSAGGVGVQSAGEFRHVQGHNHVRHVSGVLRAYPGPHSLQSDPSRACAACATAAPRPPRLPTRIVCRLSTWQDTTAFNQPLSFDTSKVTRMSLMFYVRSARDLLPSLESAPPRACRLRRRHPSPSRLLARTSRRTVCPLLNSAGRVGVQPAAELRHVQSHNHARHVLRALRACPGPPRHSQSEPTLCTPLAPPSPHAPSTPPGPHL